MSNEIVSDAAIQAAAAEMTTAIHAAVVDATARAVENGDHEAANIIKEVSDKLVGESPAEPIASGIAPEAEVDLSGITVPPPQTTVVMSSAGLNARKFGRKVAEGAAGALVAYEVSRRLPDDFNPYARIGVTVVAAAVGATAVGAAIDAASGWFGKDTA